MGEFLNDIITFGIEMMMFSFCLKRYIYYKNLFEAVKNVELHEVGSNLGNLIDKSANNKIDYIAIRGIVKPLRNAVPLQSISERNITGVIQKIRIIKPPVITGGDISTDFWNTLKRKIIDIYFEAPFVLRREYSSVEIIDPLSADILDLDVIFDTTESASRSMDFTGLYEILLGLYENDTVFMEQMLCENSTVTAIGELSRLKDKFDSLILTSPLDKSKPFCITSCSITTLLQKLNNRKKLFRIYCVGVIGLILGGVMVRRYWNKNKRNQRSA